jgi:hypothetical protein
MRVRFEAQLRLDAVPISELKLPTYKCRDEMLALVRALKEVYTNPEVNEKIYSIIENKICKGKKKTGRFGMDLWTIFVLAQVRLCLNTNYDRLHYLSNHDKLLRKLLGVCGEFDDSYEFKYQTIIDNITLLDDETLRQINDEIVKLGHGVFKKKETEALRVKTDTFVLESNVHFPTDINLLWDSARKCLDIVEHLIKEGIDNNGWRNIKSWYRELKNNMRSLSQLCKNGGARKPERIHETASNYIKKAVALSNKVKEVLDQNEIKTESQLLHLIQLERFLEMLNKHIDLVNRRLIKQEAIPQEEKVFSIFETYTEWITKGKLRPNVELGKKVSVTTDQYHLIVDFQTVEHTSDVDLIIPIASRLIDKYKIESFSSDKGGWSRENKELLQLYIPEVVIPKKGRLNNEQHEVEHRKGFIKLRHQHSAIESNINELEYNGLGRCLDRGLHGFKRYVALGVISYNLHKIGKALLKEDKRQQEKAQARQKKRCMQRQAA